DQDVDFACVSPSVEGLELGIAASGIADVVTYRHAWTVLLDLLKQTHPAIHFNEDKHVRFLHALCYVSYDPIIYMNPDAFPCVLPAPSAAPLASALGTTRATDETQIA